MMILQNLIYIAWILMWTLVTDIMTYFILYRIYNTVYIYKFTNYYCLFSFLLVLLGIV